MIQYISDEVVIKKIYPNIVKGFVDTTPQLREATVKSMVDIFPKTLNDSNIPEEIIKHIWYFLNNNNRSRQADPGIFSFN
jgi:hypothetical protein